MTSENLNKTVAYFMCHSAIFLSNIRWFRKQDTLGGPGTDYTMLLYKLRKYSIHANPDCQTRGYMTGAGWIPAQLPLHSVQTKQPYSADPGMIPFRILKQSLLENHSIEKNEVETCQCLCAERF